MINYFPKTSGYLETLDIEKSDLLDKKANELIHDEEAYERASQALRRRFVRGATEVEAMDRGGRPTKIKRDPTGGKYKYLLLGSDGNWFTPEERIWIVSMYALWQDSK